MTDPHSPLRLLAPAKLNLFLHINGRIADGQFQGYHELQTYFQLINYGDWLEIESTTAPEISVKWQAGDENRTQQPRQASDDLVYRAAKVMQQYAIQHGTPARGARIILQKNTPIGGGMGGGSSAAATTLHGLNTLWALNVSNDRLIELGASLGADVPIFINAASAWAEGIGERITPMPSPARNAWFVIIVPDATQLTQALFAHPELSRNTAKQSPSHTLAHWQTEANNAFEAIVLNESAATRACYDALQAETGFARLTGSGACVFSPVASAAQARQISERIMEIAKAAKRVIVARALEGTEGAPA